jgi:ATP sulfurylase
LIMMGIGGFSPLTGFMTKADWQGVCDKFLMADGTFWPIRSPFRLARMMRPRSRSGKRSPCTIPRARKSWPP